MNICEPFIRRPVATTLVMLAIVLFGTVAYFELPVNNLPNVDFPTINVQASLPGANPDTMATSVATPLEKRFSRIPGVDSMTSSSSLGRTNVTIQFSLDRDIDGAAQDVQVAISQVSRGLPRDMTSPPSFSKSNPAEGPILWLALTSPTMSLSAVNEYAETVIAPRLSTISGVADVQVQGAQKYAVRIQLDPQEMAARKIGIDEVVQAINSGNPNMPTGTLWGRHENVTLESTGRLQNATAFGQLIIAYRNGAPVRLADIARILDSVENDKTASWYNGVRNITLSVIRQPGSNTVEVVQNIRAVLPQLISELPPSVSLDIRSDRSIQIQESVHDVKFTLGLALVLVILVIFLFLRNVWATTIPSLALPISLIGTFAVMYLYGFSLNNLSMMALVLAVGFVVDDAIVMLENIVRHLEKGETVMQAALKGSKEIGFTIISITLSLAAVFIPVLFMGGILGRLLHEFAVTIMAAILVSGVVSLTLTPMLCSRFLRPHRTERHGRLFNFFESIHNGMTRGYDFFLQRALRHKLATMAASVLLLFGTVYLYLIIPKGFLLSEDIGQFTGRVQAIEGASFEVLAEKQQQINAIVERNPYVSGVVSNVGTNGGFFNVQLIPRSERPHVDQIMQQLRPQLAAVPGVNVYLQNPPPIRIGSFQSRALYQFTLQGANTAELYAAAQEFQEKMQSLPAVQDVSSDLELKNPQINVVLDRDKAAALNITAAQVEDALYSAYGQRQVSTIYAANDQYSVILELRPEYQRDPAALASLYVRSRTGELVPLYAVATLSRTYGPLSVSHLGQLPAVTLSFNLAPGAALGDAVTQINDLAQRELPATISTSFQGTAQAFQSSVAGLGLLLLMAVLVIYMVLGILYESFIHPLTILSGLPSAAFGALLTLHLFHLAAQRGWLSPQFDMQLDLYGFVGVIMLVGIVKKNAIMMIDFALEAQRDGMSPAEAIYQGALVRFRPIMMTTMAAMMGTLPIALGYGAGAEARRPLGVAVVGGLFFSQIVTLFLTPVFYLYMEQARGWVARLLGKREEAPAAEPVPSAHGPLSGGSVGSPMARVAEPRDEGHGERR